MLAFYICIVFVVSFAQKEPELTREHSTERDLTQVELIRSLIELGEFVRGVEPFEIQLSEHCIDTREDTSWLLAL